MSRLDLVLASSSLYRRQLLERLRLPFDWISPQVDETPLAGEAPAELALRLALAKSRAVAEQRPDALIIGCDQVLVSANHLLGKPATPQRAQQQLRQMSGAQAVFYNGICLYNSASGALQQAVETVTVHFKPLSDEVIDRYLRLEPAYDCAGSFKSEGLGIVLFERIESNDPTALIGLPLIRLCQLLENEGVSPLGFS